MPRNKYPEETEKKILDASLKLFLEKGYDETTVLDIVANLNGLTRGAFYHHFKSKEAVLDALFTHLGKNLPIEAAMSANVANGLERLKLLFTLSLQSNIASNEVTAFMTMIMSLLAEPRFSYKRHDEILSTAKVIEPIIAEGMADGSIRKGSAKAYAEIVLIMTNYWMMPKQFPGTDEDILARSELMIEILDAIGMPVINNEITNAFHDNIEALDL
ncbi:MAG: TetR/AcrR family transcriptional regulator [Defluviitaleaceae bacterium]|nr:TetR/AcrR family transcriptional regulator [Defluviitaleaceae bacterium]